MNTHIPTNTHPQRRLNAVRSKLAPSLCVRKLRRLSARVALGIVAAAATAIGCGWSGPSESVRFSGYGINDMRSYERLPPLSMKPEATKRVDYGSDDDTSEHEAAQRRENELSALWGKGNVHGATRADLELAQQALRTFLQETELEHDESWSQGSFSMQEKRNTAIDQLDALTALDHGTPPEKVDAYLTARRVYDEASPDDRLENALKAIPRDKNLEDNIAYLRAAMLYHAGDWAAASQAFKALNVAYPRSEKREAALFMSALARFKQSKSYRSDDATALSTDPCADCRDEAWTEARTLFRRVVGEYPRGRYQADARGWLAFSSLRAGDFADALANYYRLLSDESNRRARAEALRSLSLARAGADDEAMHRLEDDLSDEPSVALVYAYHNLYNYTGRLNAYDYTLPEEESGDSDSQPYSPEREREREKKRARMMQADEQDEVQRVGQFAARMLRRYPNAATSADFLVRAAGVNLESEEHRAAHGLAVRALASGARGTAREDAYWIKGVAEYRLREYDAAQRTLNNLVGANSHGRLTKRARILLALIAEDAGDLGGALEQYLWLGYQEDAAYFIDVLMSPEQLAAYIARHPSSAHLDELNYALGVRYLRAGRYAEARAAYARVRTSPQGDATWMYDERANCNKYDVYHADDKPCVSPKMANYDTRPGIRERWVLRDLKTAETLESYECAVEAAQGDEAKAETLYQMASYLYESDLLFYNPAAWGGDRYMNLAQLDASHSYRLPNEAQMLWNYSQSHDMAARALALYLEVVRRFPETRAARDALYTAAVCHIRLAGYNQYWRTAYDNGLYAGARMVTFADVRAAYPAYQFPRGDYGWEPSTRTVNGAHGWDAPPKPRPRPTRAARAKLLLAAWQPAIVNSANEWLKWLRHWLTVALLFAAALVAGRVASLTRRQLRVQLARHPQRRQQERPPELTGSAPDAPSPWANTEGMIPTWLEQLGNQLRPHAVVLYGHLRRRIEPLLHDAPGRAALVSNALSHMILIALLFELIRVI
jgi:TolA-binding protein